VLLYRNSGDFNLRVVHQARGLHRGARGLGVGKKTLVNLVHLRKFADVGQVDVNRHNVFEFKAGLLHNSRNVFQRGLGLLADASGLQLAMLVSSLLPGNVERIANYYAVTEWKTFAPSYDLLLLGVTRLYERHAQER